MSETIDRKAVEMRFDNKTFMDRVYETQRGLQKLQLNLDKLDTTKASKSFTPLNTISFDGISSSLEAIQSRFSTLGIIGMTIIQNLTNSAIDAAKKIGSALTSAITQGGWTRSTNIQKAQFQLEGLGVLWKDISEDIDYGVKDTAYGLDAAAMAASQLVASGVQYGEASDDMRKALRGISGVAAMTSSDYSEISSIFTTVAGQGKLMTMQLRQLEARGLNAAAVMAQQLGTTEEKVREMVTAGEIDFQTFSHAMDDAFGEHAKAANKTFTGALSNIKAALARTGQMFIMPAIANQDETNELKNLVDVLNAFRVIVNGVNAALAPLATKVEEVMHVLSAKVTDKLKALYSKDLDGNVISDNITAGITKAIDVFLEAAHNIYIGAMSIAKAFGTIIRAVKEAFGDIFPGLIGSADERFISFTEKIRSAAGSFSRFILNNFENIKTTFKGVFSVVDSVVEIFKLLWGGFREGTSSIEPAKKNITDFTAGLGSFLLKIRDFIKENEKFRDAIFTIGKVVGNVVSFVISAIRNVFPVVQKVFNWVTSGIKTIIGWLANFVTAVKEAFADKHFSGTEKFATILERLGKFAQFIGNLFKHIGEIVGSVIGRIIEAISRLIQTLDFDEVSKIVNGGFIGYLMYQFSVISKNIKKMTQAVKGSLMSVRSISIWINEVLKSLSAELDMKALKEFAKALLILAAAIWILSSIDTEKLLSATAAISALMWELTLVMKSLKGIAPASSSLKKSIGSFVDALSFGEQMTGILMFASAIAILAIAVKMLAGLSWEELAVGLAGVTVLMAEMVAVIKILSKNTEKIGALGVGLVLFATGVVILASAVKSLAKLSWEELAKGLAALAVSLGLITGMAIAISKTGSNLVSVGAGLVIFAAGVVVLSAALRNIAKMTWEEIAKGMATLAVSLGLITGMAIVLNATGSHLVSVGAGLVIFAAGVVVLSAALRNIAKMSWEEILKSLATLTVSLGLIAGMAIVLSKTETSLASAAAGVLVMSLALAVFTPVLKSLGKMSWGEIVKGLASLAGVFVVLGVAGYALQNLVKPILLLSAAVAVIGVGLTLVGVGLLSFATGLSALGAAIGVVGSGIKNFVVSIISIIPDAIEALAKGIAKGIVAIAGIIGEALPTLLQSVKTAIYSACDLLIESFPKIIETVMGLLDMLIEYVPQIVDRVISLVISVLNSLASRAGELVGAIANFLKAFLGAVIDQLKTVDLGGVVEALGQLAAAALMMALAGKVGIGAALKGLVIMAALIAGIGLILVGLGALMQYVPEAQQFIVQGIPILEMIGYAIGSFVGHLLSGLAVGLTSGLPTIAENLSMFMEKLQPFIDGAKQIDTSIAESVGKLALAILAITGANLLNSIVSFIGGEDSFMKFAAMIVPFGEKIVEFSSVVDGKVKESSVEAAANAGRMLAEMAAAIPNSGGALGWVMGENDLDKFAAMIVPFGEAIATFSETVKDRIDEDAVKAAANAGKTLTAFAETIPNSGGALGWIMGENDLDKFAAMIVPFGDAIATFSETVANRIDEGAVTAAANAGRALTALADTIPNSGGVLGFFTGENDIDAFGLKIVSFGVCIAAYSDAVRGVKPQAVVASATAGMALAMLANNIPNSGGLVSLFTGDNGLDTFASQLVPFGEAITQYSNSVVGVKPGAVIASAIAGQALASLATSLPSIEGVAQFFTGSPMSMNDFGNDIKGFGEAISTYSEAVTGKIDVGSVTDSANAGLALAKLAEALPHVEGIAQFFTGTPISMAQFGEDIKSFATAIVDYSNTVKDKIDEGAITASANAGLTLVELANALPHTDGVAQFFAGTPISMAQFGEDIKAFGSAIVEYSGLVANNIDEGAITASANAGATLVELANTLPNTGGVLQWFTGSPMTMTDFGADLKGFGTALVDYSTAVSAEGALNEEMISASATAGKALVELANTLPNTGGVFQFFTGAPMSMADFGSDLKEFGTALVDYSTSISANGGLKIAEIESSVKAGQALSDLANAVPESSFWSSIFGGTHDIGQFGTQLTTFGTALTSYSNSVGGLNASGIDTSIDETYKIIDLMDRMSEADFTAATNFANSMESIGKNGIAKFEGAFTSKYDEVYKKVKTVAEKAVQALKDREGDFKAPGTNAMSKYVAAITSYYNTVYNAARNNGAQAAANGLGALYWSMYNAGTNSMQGFINGMNSKSSSIYWTAYNLASSAVSAAKDATNQHSPSKEFEKIGINNDLGMVNGMLKYGKYVDEAASDVGSSSVKAANDAISKTYSYIDNNLDRSPVITPVLDLSEIQNGISYINGSLAGRFGAAGYRLGSAINDRSSYGDIYTYDDTNVIDAINGLNDRIDHLGNSIANMQIILDSGVMVGELAGPMNNAFEVMNRRMERGM